METTNPNNVNDLGYNQGSVTLSYKGKQIGNGHFPALGNQGPGISDSIDINLVGSSKGGLPKDLDVSPDSNKKSKNTKGSNNPVNMNLSLNIPVRMKTWLWTNTVDFDVNCEFEAEFMGDHLQVQSQKCDLAKA
ncbi:uncharacterized protein LOC141621064 [Silene latifolia]|uniref:uncharacterized protein LOC141621064 n=1 Tax=Silene latifolia TaxID=37657 RepID=UPI003D76C938